MLQCRDCYRTKPVFLGIIHCTSDVLDCYAGLPDILGSTVPGDPRQLGLGVRGGQTMFIIIIFPCLNILVS